MNISVDWISFLQVFSAALVSAMLVVGCYALGLRLLVRAGRVPVVIPQDFADAITTISPKEAARALKAAEKATRKNPLTGRQKRLALVGAYVCFAICALAVLGGLLLIVLRY